MKKLGCVMEVKMKRIFILYSRFYDMDGKNLEIGGIETYIQNLLQIIKKLQIEPYIFQFANKNFHRIFNGVNIYGVDISHCKRTQTKNKMLYEEVEKIADLKNDIIIFASDYLNVKNSFEKSICIQHGIAWDYGKKERDKRFYINLFINSLKNIGRINRLNYAKNVVCVDYNFLNWYRSQVQFNNTNLNVIPNFVNIDDDINLRKNNEIVKIIFARRFETYRGSRIFSDAIKDVLLKRENIEITFAGNGSDEEYLKSVFYNVKNVKFIKYDATESLKIHEQYDIAVIPSIGSEGTTLSLLEAMASKCAIIASNVGGITNVIIDGYNGILIKPNSKFLEDKLIELIDNYYLREELSLRAYDTVKSAFSYDSWEKKWLEIISKVDKREV